MTTVEGGAIDRPLILDRIHDVMLLLLVALRPWCWDGAPGQPAELVWQGLAAGAVCIVALERAAGLRPAWAWSWRGGIAVVLVLALLPAALHAPEPAPSWCRWTGWLACLAAAAYAMQVLPGRQRLALAGFGAGLAVTVLLGLAQPLWVLPAMAAAQQAGSSVFAALPGEPGAISERIANGGAFATFTLANQFGAYLALMVPMLAGVVWATWLRTSGQRPATSGQQPAASDQGPAASGQQPATSDQPTPLDASAVCCGVLLILALVALAFTSAKGAWLALATGCGLAWWLAVPGRWWRWLPVPLGAINLAALLHFDLAKASIAVREGYWRSAITLAQEGGLGLGGFGAHQPRVMQVGDEPTRYVHNEVLEAAVAGGWVLGALAVVALLALAWPRRTTAEASPQPGPPRALVVALWIAMPYLAALGAFDGHFSWWPGGADLVVSLAWAVLLGGIAAGTALVLWRVEPPPAWAWAAGLCAVALKALIDFDFHAGGVLGSALLVAACAGAPLRQAAGAVGRWLPLAAALACTGLIGTGVMTGLRLAEAEDWVATARQVQSPEVARLLANRLQVDPASPPAALAAAAGERAWALAVGAPGTRQGALELLPATAATLDLAGELAAAAPHSASIALRHARLLTAGKRWREAVEEVERAVRLAPTAPRVLEMAAEVLERISTVQPAVGERAKVLRAEAARLLPLVHPGMRGR